MAISADCGQSTAAGLPAEKPALDDAGDALSSTDYAGPLNTFVDISSLKITGDAGSLPGTALAPGDTTSFSLERPRALIFASPVAPDAPSVPEPASIVILAFCLAVVITARGYNM